MPIRSPRLATLVATLVAVVVLVAAGFLHSNRPPRSLLETLVEVDATGTQRTIKARLSGDFLWKPHHHERSVADRRTLELRSTAQSVLLSTEGLDTADSRRLAALAYLLSDRPDEAATTIERTAEAARNAQLWSDLAAASYESSLLHHEPVRLGYALAAADAALRIDPQYGPALFNRALIVERLGLRDQARDAWKKYLSVDGRSGWAAEARAHLQNLPARKPFRVELEGMYDRLAADESLARDLARQRPQEARLWGETEILGRWASSYLKNESNAANAHLRIARAWGDQLARDHGDRMLTSAVVAIDEADGAQRQSLALGHIGFRDAQKAYMGNKAAAAHPMFVDAAVALERGGSPISRIARYFATNTAYDMGRVAESIAAHEVQLASTPGEFPAQRAQLQWQLGRAYLLDGRWGEAVDTLKASIDGFECLHELAHAATVREILAELYDRIGNDESAWKERMTSLRELGLVTTTRLQIAISSMTRLALMKGHWQQAVSFLRLELDVARVVSTPLRRIEMTLLRARLNERLGARDASLQDLAEARAEIGKLDDPALSSLMEANAIMIEGALAGDPREAIRLFTVAIDSHRSRGRRMLLPEVLLLRGRAHAARGDLLNASRDFDDGIAKLEAGRETLPPGTERLGFFHAADEIFEEAISLALRRDDAKIAFQYAERARARQLLDTLGVSWPSIESDDIPSDTAIVEYVSLEERLLIFVCDREGVRVREVPVRRTALEEQLRSPAANLHRTLIDPVAPSLATRPNLVIVPDRVLSPVSFAALRGSDGRYLMERHTIRVSPSAAVYVRLNAPRGAARRGGKVLIVASSATPDAGLDPLPAAEREARRIARLYRNVSLLNGAEATNRAFREAAPFADIIHFAGHATVGADRDTALVLTRAQGDSWRADARSIAALKLDRTSLVVLAGCNTARGKAMANEGTLSLARAFLAAGVPSVIATLQPIADDEAEELFTRLHENVARGLEPAEALRAVQIEWSRRADVSAATWASIEVIGR